MGSRACLFLFCLLLVITPAHALCQWSVEVSPPPGIAACTGFWDVGEDRWPRMPTDAEIEAAKQEYLDYRLSESGTQRRIDDVRVAKFHTCNGERFENHVEMEVTESWWWESGSGTEGKWLSGKENTFLIYTPGRNGFEFVFTIAPSPYFSGLYSDTAQGFSTGACTSGSTGTGPAPPPEDETPWTVIIGAGALIGAGLVVGAKKLGAKGKPAKEQKKEKEEGVRYILQLSADRLTVTPETAARLKVTAWKVVGKNPPAPAPEAAITLTVPPGNEGLSVRPASGSGSVEAAVALASPVSASPVVITVTASVGTSAESAPVTVEIPAEYLMEFF